MIFFDDIVEGLMRGFSGGRRETKAERAEVGIYIRKQELDQEKRKNFLFFFITFLVEFLFFCFLLFNSHLSIDQPFISGNWFPGVVRILVCK